MSLKTWVGNLREIDEGYPPTTLQQLTEAQQAIVDRDRALHQEQHYSSVLEQDVRALEIDLRQTKELVYRLERQVQELKAQNEALLETNRIILKTLSDIQAQNAAWGELVTRFVTAGGTPYHD